MRDGLVLRLVKRTARWGWEADLAIHRMVGRARGERPWTLAGQCRRSGFCCEHPAIAVGLLVWALPLARRIFVEWQKRINGFELVHLDGDAQALVFRCTHFDRRTRSCDSYGSRPAICRDYPRLLLWQANPELFAGCGYRAAPPNAAGLRRALDGLDLTAEQREKLRHGLRLEG